MTASYSPPLQQAADYRNLQRLFMLRNIAIIGELIALYVTTITLQIHLPILSFSLIVFTHAAFNLFTLFRIRWGGKVTPAEFLLQLLVDVFVLTGLLYLSGGASNPFVLMFLLPIVIATVVLSARYTWVLTITTAVCYSLLMWKYQPLPVDHASHGAFSQHVLGMWLAFVASAAVTAYFVTGMRKTLRDREKQLANAREKQLRDRQLVSLGTLAASTAHEMGTPLGTMVLLCDELDEQLTGEPKATIETLRSQVHRCKHALATLSSSAGSAQASGGQVLSVDTFLDQLTREWRAQYPSENLEYECRGTRPAPSIIADITLKQALTNILDNAIEVSPGDVTWQASWDDDNLILCFRDRGPGLNHEARQSIGRQPYSNKQDGLGLGLFLTHSIINQFGGHVELFNRKHGGLLTRVSLPLASTAQD